MHEVLKQKVVEALQTLGIEGVEPVIEFPGDLSHGDYATSTALAAAKAAGMNPHALAEKLVSALGTIEDVEKIEIAGPGFINFHLSREYFSKTIQEIDEEWGKNTSLQGKKVMVEYTDPNPFKEFHIGHLMSNAVGESIARLHEYRGALVLRANWQGDVGPHVAKAIWGKQQKPELSWGEAYVYGAEKYDTNKEEIDSINKKVYAKSDVEINKLYTAGRESSLEHFEDIYKKLGTRFDYYFFEGTEGLEGQTIVDEHLAKGVFEKSDGAVVFPGEKYGLHTRVFLTSQSLPTYEAKELGLNKAKFEKEPDLYLSVIITANEQSDYFKVVLKAMEMIFPNIAAKTKHVAHGMMRFAQGKMSSRKGNVVTGESLINDLIAVVKERATENKAVDGEQLAEQVAVAALKFQVLKGGVSKDIIFERERALSVEGDSGPYLQYSYVRAMSILEKAKQKEDGVVMIYHNNWSGEKVPEFERLLPRFPEIVARAAREYEPHYVTTYLTELAGAFNSWYANERIIGTEDEAYKLLLVQAFAITMKNGLWLLGIVAPEKM